MRLSSLNREDYRQLAEWLHTADALVEPYSDGEMLSGDHAHDLPLLQRVLDAADARALPPEAVHAIAVALGRLLMQENDAIEWAIAEGERRRGHVLRRAGTLEWVSPLGSLAAHLRTHSRANAAQVLADMAQQLRPQHLAAAH
jgi:hypothetical protein